mgnify:CR=1 FL=1
MICIYYVIITIIFLLISLKYKQLSLEFIKYTWNYLFLSKPNQVNKNLKFTTNRNVKLTIKATEIYFLGISNNQINLSTLSVFIVTFE